MRWERGKGRGGRERERTQQSVYLAFAKLNPNLTYRSSFSNDNYKINTANSKKTTLLILPLITRRQY